ncbi:LysR family transcriptional regulator [Mycolicibacter minnesotensis]|nr:LysR family transcriptional regulator [Mycolicibacter minnesotensis]
MLRMEIRGGGEAPEFSHEVRRSRRMRSGTDSDRPNSIGETSQQLDYAARVRIKQLEYVAAVTRLGSLRRAGESLKISQPALSETLRNLESELGVTLLDRQRSGARISADGRELLPHIVDILEAVDRLRSAASEQQRTSRMLRVGTVGGATVPLLLPAIEALQAQRVGTQVEVLTAIQEDIHRALREGSLDLGLANLLDGDDPESDLTTVQLLRGRPVVCLRADSALAQNTAICADELRAQDLIAMRAGYAMHRFARRLFGTEMPTFLYSADGAEMGKLMVAQGLGVTILPDYSVAGDPLVRAGVLTLRPLADESTAVSLVMQTRAVRHVPQALGALQSALQRRALDYQLAI